MQPRRPEEREGGREEEFPATRRVRLDERGWMRIPFQWGRLQSAILGVPWPSGRFRRPPQPIMPAPQPAVGQQVIQHCGIPTLATEQPISLAIPRIDGVSATPAEQVIPAPTLSDSSPFNFQNVRFTSNTNPGPFPLLPELPTASTVRSITPSPAPSPPWAACLQEVGSGTYPPYELAWSAAATMSFPLSYQRSLSRNQRKADDHGFHGLHG